MPGPHFVEDPGSWIVIRASHNLHQAALDAFVASASRSVGPAARWTQDVSRGPRSLPGAPVANREFVTGPRRAPEGQEGGISAKTINKGGADGSWTAVTSYGRRPIPEAYRGSAPSPPVA
jgi:hypothetical protein